MTTKKVMKILVALLVIVLTLTVLSQITLAATGGKSIDPATASLSNTFQQKDTSGASDAASNVIGAIINIAQVIGMGVAIIMLIVLAIQYIAASPEGKAEIKKNSTIYIVGAIILFAASGILGIIRKFAVDSVGSQGD